MMAYLREHCDDCKQALGRDWKEVHRWLDELFQKLGQAHRCARHHVEGIEEVRRMWGDEAALAAKIHIIVDCWGIPSKAEYENGFVNQFGFTVESTEEEAKKMLLEVLASKKLAAAVVDKPVLIIVAGPNGSGKTTITEKSLRHEWMQECVYVNPDIIAQEQFGGWNSLEAVKQAADHAQRLREEYLRNRVSFAFESVFSTQGKVDFVLQAKALGFFVRFFFICTEGPWINASRIARRVMAGGHEVRISKIISRFPKALENGARIARHVDRAYFYDNTQEDADPRLLFKAVDGRISKVYTALPAWAETISETLAEADLNFLSR